jgi:hypothetical protein
MRMRCECVVLVHASRCEKDATVRCVKCGDRLCGQCAQKHHYHSEMENLEVKK